MAKHLVEKEGTTDGKVADDWKDLHRMWKEYAIEEALAEPSVRTNV